jgi:hypothetical protein
MRSFLSVTGILFITLAVAAGGPARAGGPPAGTSPEPPFGPHNGIVTKAQAYLFETVLAPDGILVYLFDLNMAPLMMQRLKATATVTRAGSVVPGIPLELDSPKEGEKILYFCPMHPPVAQMEPGKCEPCGGMDLIPQDRLRGKIELPAGAVTAAITIQGLKGSKTDAVFTVVRPAPTAK